jgi:serine/threonine protein kinase
LIEGCSDHDCSTVCWCSSWFGLAFGWFLFLHCLQVSRLLQYAPQKRYTPYQAMTHPFFDELRDPATVLPNGKPLPPLFNWLPGELDDQPEDILSKLRPRAAGSSSSSSAQAQQQ